MNGNFDILARVQLQVGFWTGQDLTGTTSRVAVVPPFLSFRSRCGLPGGRRCPRSTTRPPVRIPYFIRRSLQQRGYIVHKKRCYQMHPFERSVPFRGLMLK